MNRTLSNSAKAALRELPYKENAVKGLRLLADSGAEGVSGRLKLAEAELCATRSALDSLTEEHRDILTQFYVKRQDGAVAGLCRKYCCSQSTVYRMHRDALRALVMSLYGRAE